MFWAAYALCYDLIWDNQFSRRIAEAVTAELDPELPVQEVGAGTGLITERLLAAGCTVSASEPSRHMRSRFVRRLPGTDVDNALLADLERSERPVSVVAVNVLHLVPSPAEAVKHLRRVAGPTGRVVIVTPDPLVNLRAVASAQRRAGVSRLRIARFFALHAVLAPLTALSGMAVESERLSQVVDQSALRRSRLLGVSQLLVLGGI